MIDQTNQKGFLSIEHRDKTPSIQPIKKRLTQNNTTWFNKILKKLSMSFLKHRGQMISQFQITQWKLNGNFTQLKFTELCILSVLHDIAFQFSLLRI